MRANQVLESSVGGDGHVSCRTPADRIELQARGGRVARMSDCCSPDDYRRLFSSKEAARRTRGYRRRGLDSTESPMVAALVALGVAGATVIDVGAGTGQAHLELLRHGARRAVAVDISRGYEKAAEELADEMGLADRVDRRWGDFVDIAPEIPSGDIVFANRVVCCYVEASRLMDALDAASSGVVALSFPRRHLVGRFVMGVFNRLLRLRRCGFRAFVHPREQIEGRLEAAGRTPVASGTTVQWHWSVWA